MKRTYLFLISLMTVINLFAQQNEFIADELIISFDEAVTSSEIHLFLDNNNFNIIKKFSSTDNAFLVRKKGVLKRQIQQSYQTTNLSSVANQIKESSLTRIVEPNYILYATQTLPNDQYFNNLWALHNMGQTNGTTNADISAVDAWDNSTGAEVIIGIIDSGIDFYHQDLIDNIWTNPNEIANNGIDDDGNGYIDDIHGWDFYNNDNDPYDDNGHGTHCAGIIGAMGNNDIGVAGVNWQAKMVALKFLNSSGNGPTSDAIEAVEYATAMGIPITNNSWGGGSYSQLLYNAIASAGEQGLLFIAAAGNDAVNNDIYNHYPSSYDLNNIISVAATDHNDDLAHFSNYGITTVDLGAPGVNILSSLPGNNYGSKDGTSMATPYVSGAASMLIGLNQNLTAQGTKEILLNSTDPIPALENKTLSGGRLNLYNAMELIEEDSIPPAAITDLVINFNAADWVTLKWTATGDDQFSGKANKYDVRFNRSEITQLNFDEADQLLPFPKPGQPGSSDSVKISNLDILTTYYFAIKVIDEQDNCSQISNIISTTTRDKTPYIYVYNDTLNFDDTIIGATDTLKLAVLNTGLEDLLISGIDVSPSLFGINKSFASIDGNDSEVFEVYFSPQNVGSISGMITFESNDPENPSYNIILNGAGIYAPLIAITPDSVSAEIRMGEIETHAVNIQNSGLGNLDYMVSIDYANNSQVLENSPLFTSDEILFPNELRHNYKPGQIPQSEKYRSALITNQNGENWGDVNDDQLPLINVLENLNKSFADITNTIPNRFDFLEGITGYYIANGGNNMYDYGNYLSTNLENNISYSDNQVITETGFGSGGQYFTRKYAGLFILAADIADLDYFIIDGYLGNYGSGSLNGSVLYTNVNGVGYYGFVKRVYNSNTPSVNHLFIIPENQQVQHDFPMSVRYDYHYLLNLQNSKRMYYLLYAGSNGAFIDDEATMNIMNAFLSVATPNRNWLSAAPSSGNIDPGSNENIEVSINTMDLQPGDYNANLLINSNDPLNHSTDVPVRISVAGSPVLSVESDTLNFGNIYVGKKDTLLLPVKNTGTEDLLIHSTNVSSSVFSVSPSFAGIDVGEEEIFKIVSYSETSDNYSATLTFYNNGIDTSYQIQLLSNVINPPIAEISPDSLFHSIYSGDEVSSQITINNPGTSELVWNLSVDFSESSLLLLNRTPFTNQGFTKTSHLFNEYDAVKDRRDDLQKMNIPADHEAFNLDSEFDDLTEILNSLNQNYEDVINVIPSRYDFYDGISGYYISDGGNDMYDGGNYLSTNYGSYIYYSDNTVQTNSLLGASGKYFTRKYPGLFILAADMDDVSNFYIDGTLGGYSGSFVDGAIFEVRIRGANYHGFLKRTYYTGNKPSVNHLIIIPSNTEVAQYISSDPYSDYHMIQNLNNSKRMYYLLFAGSNGAFIDDNAVLNIMKTFLTALNITPEWITVLPDSGVVPAASSGNIDVNFNASNLESGNYLSNINIVSNDPFNVSTTIPAELQIIGAADISLTADSIDFGDTFLTSSDSVKILIDNTGTDVLTVSNIVSDNNAFTVNRTIFALNPGDYDTLAIYFEPQTEQKYSGTLTLSTNDPDEMQKMISVEGRGVFPPAVVYTPSSILDTLNAGQIQNHTINIGNTGQSNLNWNAFVDFSTTSSVLSESPSFSQKTIWKNIQQTANIEENESGEKIFISDNIGQNSFQSNQDNLSEQIDLDLESIWENLNSNYNIVNNLIPNRYDFIDGQSGYYIYDGGNNMYDYGNYLFTSNGSYINYTNNVLSSSGYFGGDGRYFTAKYDGLFVLAANIQNLSSFTIDGNLGSSSSGIVEGTVLNTSYGKNYTAFVKKVYNTGSIPSVNHMVIIESDPSVQHEFSTATYSDYHRVFNLNNVNRIYYLLYASGNGGYIDNNTTLTIMKAFLSAIGEIPEWLSLNSVSGIIEPEGDNQLDAQINTIGLSPGSYNASIMISNNDPENHLIDIPVTVSINSSPKISFDKDSLYFPNGVVGNSDTMYVNISNVGTDILNLSAISTTNTVFSTGAFPPSLNINQTFNLPVIFTPSDTGSFNALLQISSNDPDTAVALTKLSGHGIQAPDISVAPDSVSIIITAGQADSTQLEITNNGHSDLNVFMSIDYSEMSTVLMKSPVFTTSVNQAIEKKIEDEGFQKNDRSTIYAFTQNKLSEGIANNNSSAQTALEKILLELNENYQNINTIIPNRFDFSNGESGYYISDGGSDMYDGGNYLNTNLGSSIAYSNKIISNSNNFGQNGKYFTAKYPGLFVMAADINGVENFTIDGSLGADGSGSADGTILETRLNGRSYYGFVKRVYNANDPSVNHLIIIPKNTLANHEFSTNTNSDYHRVLNLMNTSRIYYLLYAGRNGEYINDNETKNIMRSFLSSIGVSPGWVAVSPDSITISPQNMESTTLSFHAEDLLGGDYDAQLMLATNVPDKRLVEIPIRMEVIGIPDMIVSKNILDFGNVYIGLSDTLHISILNAGSDELIISDIISDTEIYTTDKTNFTIAPEDTAFLTVIFTPQSEQGVLGQLTIESNDPDDPSSKIYLQGSGKIAPEISVSATAISDTLEENSVSYHAIQLTNTGGSILNWKAFPKEQLKSEVIYHSPLFKTKEENLQEKEKAKNRIKTESDNKNLFDFSDYVQPVNKSLDSLQQTNNKELPLSDILANFLDNYTDITSIIPDCYYFSEGESGYYIVDGGDDMYDYGNILRTNIGRDIIYSNNLISGNQEFGNSGQYFTSKVPGLFILSADISDIEHFEISGTLGANSSASVDGAIIKSQKNGVHYSGFIKRVFGAQEPSVNHLIIIPDDPNVSQQFSTSSYNDYHELYNLQSSKRIYYLLFAGSNGKYINDSQTLKIMEAFLDVIVNVPEWITVIPGEGQLGSNENVNLSVALNSNDADKGQNNAQIIISSNAVNSNYVSIPVDLYVTGQANLTVEPDTIDFGVLYNNSSPVDYLISLKNSGDDSLIISSISVTDSLFEVNKTSFSIAPLDSTNLILTFSSARAGSFAAEMNIVSNDADTPLLKIPVKASNIYTSELHTDMDSLQFEIEIGDSSTFSFEIENKGLGELTWNVFSTKFYSDSLPYSSIDYMRQYPEHIFKELFEIIVGINSGTTLNDYDLFENDLNEKQAVILNIIEAETELMLDSLDIFITNTDFINDSTFAISILKEWVEKGNTLIISGGMEDNSQNVNVLLNGSGITAHYSQEEYYNVIDHIFEHFTTLNVDTIIYAPFRFTFTVSGSAIPLAFYDQDNIFAAVSDLGKGKVVTLGNDIFKDQFKLDGQNRLFCYQLIEWLGEFKKGIYVTPRNGILFPGEGKQVDINIKAKPPTAGEYTSALFIKSNDPNYSQLMNFISIKFNPVTGLFEILNRQLPQAYELKQNYPNPFNPETHIVFGIPKPSQVVIKIYNTRGQLLETLYKGLKPAGYHRVEFNGRDYASGLYIYKIEAGNFVDVKKMILIK